MPDPTNKTISATQMPALFNASPYLTRWMLYHQLRGASLPRTETDRMHWGTKLQPLILDRAREDLKLAMMINFENTYVRSNHGPLGYTSDAVISMPDRGPGTLEAKCVFDYGTWMREWGGGDAVPKHIELQHQQQLTVGDGQQPYEWGVIAVWVCAEMKYFHRTRDDKVSAAIIDAANTFMLDVEHAREPEPFASGLELPILNELFPVKKGNVLDLVADPEANKFSQLAASYKQFKAEENFNAKAAEEARTRLLMLAMDHDTVLLPGGVKLKIKSGTMKEHVRKAATWRRLEVELPEQENTEELPDGLTV